MPDLSKIGEAYNAVKMDIENLQMYLIAMDMKNAQSSTHTSRYLI